MPPSYFFIECLSGENIIKLSKQTIKDTAAVKAHRVPPWGRGDLFGHKYKFVMVHIFAYIVRQNICYTATLSHICLPYLYKCDKEVNTH